MKKKRAFTFSFLSLVMAGCNGTLSQTYDMQDGRGNSQIIRTGPFSTSVTTRTDIPTQDARIDRCVTRYQNYTYELRPATLPNGHIGVIAIQRNVMVGDPVAQCTNEFLHGIPLNNPQFWNGGMMMPYGYGGYGYGGYGTFQGRMTVYKPESSGGEN